MGRKVNVYARRTLQRAVMVAGVAALSSLAPTAHAADLGGNCCADLEERIAELEATTARKGNRKVTLTIGRHDRPTPTVAFSKGSFDYFVRTGFHGQVDVVTPGTPNITGGHGRVIVLDTSSFTHEDRARRSVLSGVDQTISGVLDGSIACAAPEGNADAATAPQQCTKRGVWAAAIGGYSDIDATRTAWAAEQTLVGGLAGAHVDAAPGITAGLFGGFAETALSTGLRSEFSAEHVETTFAIAGAFARLRNGQGFADVSVTGLWSDSDRRRVIANNFSGPLDYHAVTASANGWLISPALTIGLRLPVASDKTLVPAIKLRGAFGQEGGFSEAGAFARFSADARDIADIEGRVELGFHMSFATDAQRNGLVRATAGLSYFGAFGDGTINGRLAGQAISFSSGAPKSEFGGYVGLGLDVPLSDAASLFADTEMHLTDRAQEITGFGGVKVKF